ncbi:hypothetical protein BKA57DRAFT_484392, partial [Linnemannia elongata]
LFVLSLSFSFFNFITTDTHTHSYIHPISLQDTLVFEGSLPFCNTRAFEHPAIAHSHTTITTTATITHYCDLKQATQERNASLALRKSLYIKES